MRRRLLIVRILLTPGRMLSCDCMWERPFGLVIAAGCARHD